MKILLRKKLKEDLCPAMLAVIRCRISCLPVSYTKI